MVTFFYCPVWPQIAQICTEEAFLERELDAYLRQEKTQIATYKSACILAPEIIEQYHNKAVIKEIGYNELEKTTIVG